MKAEQKMQKALDKRALGKKIKEEREKK